MAKIHKFSNEDESVVQYCFHCPGCSDVHCVQVKGSSPWQWNQDTEKPTFSPSLLVWSIRPELRCHSFVRDGKIQFLDDCFHDLKGQTVEIPEWED